MNDGTPAMWICAWCGGGAEDEQALDALTRQQLAPGAVTPHRFFAAAALDLAQPGAQVSDKCQVMLAVGLELGARRINARFEHGHAPRF